VTQLRDGRIKDTLTQNACAWLTFATPILRFKFTFVATITLVRITIIALFFLGDDAITASCEAQAETITLLAFRISVINEARVAMFDFASRTATITTNEVTIITFLI